jgi:hypothetical protein
LFCFKGSRHRAVPAICALSASTITAIIRERVMSGLARAKAEGVTLELRSLEQANATKVAAIKAELAAGKGIRRIARALGVRVKRNLDRW